MDVALDYGISEWEFWDMTIAELTRAVESKKRVLKIQQQEKAFYDYCGGSIGVRLQSRTGHSPYQRHPQPSGSGTQRRFRRQGRSD